MELTHERDELFSGSRREEQIVRQVEVRKGAPPCHPQTETAPCDSVDGAGLTRTVGVRRSLSDQVDITSGPRAREKLLSGQDSVETLGPLLDQLAADLFHTVELLDRITALLLHVREEHSALFSDRHYDVMNASLRQWAEGERPLHRGAKAYVRAILDAYSHVGDVRALPDVARIANRGGPARFWDAGITAAAGRCLVCLNQAKQTAEQPRALLRASERPQQQEELLRPAACVNAFDAEQMLRAAEAPEDAGISRPLPPTSGAAGTPDR